MKEVVSTSSAPAAVGPYSQAVVANGFMFCSGQISIDPATNQVNLGDLESQTHQVLKNIQAVLAAKGKTLAHVVKTTIFLTDMNDFAKVNEIYASYFAEPYPARSTVAVAGLPKGVRVEIEVLAI